MWMALAREAVDCGLKIHKDIGPGLFESVYEAVMADLLSRRGLQVQRQVAVAFEYEGRRFEEAFRVDLLVENRLVIEVKSTEKVATVHAKQLLTYLRIMKLPVGLLMNFGQVRFVDGLQRIANRHIDDVK
jgi:GxxExxY protein